MSILSSLHSAAGALQAFDRVLEVTQNNVANLSTPGFVKQRQILATRPFDPDRGSQGGVFALGIQSSRDEYAEQAVRRQAVQLGRDQQSVRSLTGLQSVFDISGNAGIPNALSNLFQSFSAWAQSPTDSISRQNVLERAGNLAEVFHQAGTGLVNAARDSERQIQQTVDDINRIAARLREFNVQALSSDTMNSSVDAGIHAALEELSQYSDVTALHQDDGSVTVLLNGETPLVVAAHQYPVGYRLEQPSVPPPVNAGARPFARIQSWDGVDVTAHTTGGKLGSLLDFRNRVLPSYMGDAYQVGEVNRMAQQVADRVNELLSTGNGPPLFTYDAASPTTIAGTLKVNPALTPGQLAASAPGPPLVSNGIPLALSALSNPESAADQIDGASYVEFYGNLAARAGRALNDAQTQTEIQESTVTQAKALREQLSGVSLDEEAVIMIQFQRAYEANSRFVTVLNDLTRTIINMLQP